jgi:hypothetical protein
MKQKRADQILQIQQDATENGHAAALPATDAPAIRYTELPEAKAGEPLAEEWNTYRREIGRLLAEGQQGRHVVIKGSEIIGIYDSWEKARQAGLKRFHLEPFFVHSIRDREPYLHIRGLNLPCPS